MTIPDEWTAAEYRAAAHYCREEMRKAELRAAELEKSDGELREEISQIMSTDRTNEAWSHQQAELATLRAENARLAASVTELSADGALLSMTHQRDQLRSEVARLDEKLKEVEVRESAARIALDAFWKLCDTSCPAKFDAAMSWVENDRLVREMAKKVLTGDAL